MKKYIDLYLNSKSSFCDNIDCDMSAIIFSFSNFSEVSKICDNFFSDFSNLLNQINGIFGKINFSRLSENHELIQIAFEFGSRLVDKYCNSKVDFKNLFFIVKHFKKKHIELIYKIEEIPENINKYISVTEIIYNNIEFAIFESTELILTEKFKYRLEWEKRILEISNIFINISAEKIDEEINKTLKNIGKFIGIDRCGIFIFHNDDCDMSNVFEWCDDGVEPQIRHIQKVSFKSTSYWFELIQKNSVIKINNIDELPAAASAERQVMEKGSIKSLISIPMLGYGKNIGFISFESVKDNKRWLNEDTVMLEILSEILANTIERKKRDMELKLAKTKADAANIAKTNFLASVSHEIRTPLNSIFGFTDLLIKTSLDESQIKYLENIRKSNKVLLSLVNDILDFAKIETGRMSIESVENDLMQILNDIILICQGEIKEKKVAIILNVQPPINFNVFCDSVRIKQILINLINNAIKFTESGEIKLNVFLRSETKKSAEFEFQVIDNGIGIPADVQSKIFQPFIQADGTINKKYGGTGLGLSISNNLINLMGGGNILLESQPGTGSKFSFKLQFQKFERLTEDNDAAEADSVTSFKWHELNKNLLPEGKVLKVLIVEDNIFNSQLISDILDLAGHQSVIADNGLKAVELVQRDQFDAILMDRQLPNMTGCEAAKKIRALGYNDIPIIATTASNSLREKQECLDSGMDQILVKPFDVDSLESFIIAVIKNKKTLK